MYVQDHWLISKPCINILDFTIANLERYLRKGFYLITSLSHENNIYFLNEMTFILKTNLQRKYWYPIVIIVWFEIVQLPISSLKLLSINASRYRSFFMRSRHYFFNLTKLRQLFFTWFYSFSTSNCYGNNLMRKSLTISSHILV